jgi:hypothetical protein
MHFKLKKLILVPKTIKKKVTKKKYHDSVKTKIKVKKL